MTNDETVGVAAVSQTNSAARNADARGDRLRFLLLILLIGALTLTTSAPRGSTAMEDSASRIAGARATLEKFLKHLEAEEYSACYDLLSAKYRQALKRESGISNRTEYQRIHAYRLLRWHTPVIDDMRIESRQRPSSIIAFVDMTYEQYIVREIIATDRISLVFVLIQDRGRWVIDQWS